MQQIECSRRDVIQLLAGSASALFFMPRKAEVLAVRTDGWGLNFIYCSKVIDETGKPLPIFGFAADFKRANGEVGRQAVLLREGASMREVGRALTLLGDFLQNPDERLIGDGILCGNELNRSEFDHGAHGTGERLEVARKL